MKGPKVNDIKLITTTGDQISDSKKCLFDFEIFASRFLSVCPSVFGFSSTHVKKSPENTQAEITYNKVFSYFTTLAPTIYLINLYYFYPYF